MDLFTAENRQHPPGLCGGLPFCYKHRREDSG